YLIVGLSLLLNPFTSHSIDMAGAFISPLLALLGGWFLWWWSRGMKFRYRWVMLILYAISPILVHGTQLGRPDHQSLVIGLLTLAICAEWSLQMKAADMAAFSEVDRWAALSGVAWGFAIWVSAYEPLVLFFVVTAATAVVNRRALFARDRRTTWIVLAAVIALVLLAERRLPSLAIVQSNVVFKNWTGPICELWQDLPANPMCFSCSCVLI